MGGGDESDLHWFNVGCFMIGWTPPNKVSGYSPSGTFNVTARWNESSTEYNLETVHITVVPEPMTFLMTGIGFLVVLGYVYRKRR